MNLLRKGAVWLAEVRSKSMADPVVYSRGSACSNVAAALGATSFTTDQSDGLVTETRTRDYLIRACELKLDDIPVEPQAGDRITDDDGSVYETQAIDGQQCWRWSDPQHTTYRIHTRYVGAAPLTF